MTSSAISAKAKFTGNRPLLFDRYAGNEAKLLPIDKVYWSREGQAVIPSLNVISGLTAENSKSVSKMVFGRKAKPISQAILQQLHIPEFEIPLTKNGESIQQDNFDNDFEVVHHVARINKSGTAIPNPKERPLLSAPWEMEFDFTFMKDAQSELNWDVMLHCLDKLGVIGLGTYRPMYGGFSVEVEEI